MDLVKCFKMAKEHLYTRVCTGVCILALNLYSTVMIQHKITCVLCSQGEVWKGFPQNTK